MDREKYTAHVGHLIRGILPKIEVIEICRSLRTGRYYCKLDGVRIGLRDQGEWDNPKECLGDVMGYLKYKPKEIEQTMKETFMDEKIIIKKPPQEILDRALKHDSRLIYEANKGDKPYNVKIYKMPIGKTTEDGPYFINVDDEAACAIDGRMFFETMEQANNAMDQILTVQKVETPERRANIIREDIKTGINALQQVAHANSSKAGWWKHPDGQDLLEADPRYAPYVLATKMMLMVSETAEAMEGIRKDAMDDKLPHRTMEECEIADIIIRALDYAGKRKLDIAGAILEKMDFNTTRPDHNMDNRRKPGGKKF